MVVAALALRLLPPRVLLRVLLRLAVALRVLLRLAAALRVLLGVSLALRVREEEKLGATDLDGEVVAVELKLGELLALGTGVALLAATLPSCAPLSTKPRGVAFSYQPKRESQSWKGVCWSRLAAARASCILSDRNFEVLCISATTCATVATYTSSRPAQSGSLS